MAVSRPFLLAVLGFVLLAATLMASRNAQETSGTSKPAAHATAAKHPQSNAPSASKSQPHASKPSPQKRSTSSSVAEEHAAPRAHAARRHSQLSKPAAVARAIGNRKVVVLAFFQPGADDRADRTAVGAVKTRHLAAVFTDRINNIGRYEPIVGALDIHQAPAIVVVDSKTHAHVIEGYVDPQSLTQEVKDSGK